MNATEFFQEIIKPNYDETKRTPDNLRLLVNAIISMNTVAEFVALDRLGYVKVSLQELAKEANEIRRQYACLEDLKFCAETLKHVRKLSSTLDSDVPVMPSSTSILPLQQTSAWFLDTAGKTYYLKTVADDAFRTIEMFPEFTQQLL